MILLDSHAFYWVVTDQPNFGSTARHKIATSPAVYVSSISLLELRIKALANRLPEMDLIAALEDAQLKHLDFSTQDAASIEALNEEAPKDPFDRALLAQARNNKLDFYTADKKLLALGLPWVVNIGE